MGHGGYSRLVGGLVAVLGIVGCATPGGRGAPGGEVLVHGGVVVRHEGPDERLDLLLVRGDRGLVLEAAAPGALEAADTLDATGLFFHTTNPFEAEVRTTPGRMGPAAAMLVLRRGRGPASPAEWLIQPDTLRRLAPAENHPPGRVPDAVGCYRVERGEWEGAGRVDSLTLGDWWVPDDLRLHWQYHWPYGPDRFLVATDAAGRVDPAVHFRFAWSELPGDSLRVVFSSGFEFAVLRVGRRAGGYEGTVRIGTDAGGVTRAPVRLNPVGCPSGSR